MIADPERKKTSILSDSSTGRSIGATGAGGVERVPSDWKDSDISWECQDNGYAKVIRQKEQLRDSQTGMEATEGNGPLPGSGIGKGLMPDLVYGAVTSFDWMGNLYSLCQAVIPGTKTDRAWQEGAGFLKNGTHYYVPGVGWVRKVNHYLEKDPGTGEWGWSAIVR